MKIGEPLYLVGMSQMPMRFIVTDRESIESGILVRSAYAVISIRDPNRRKVRVRNQSGLREVLHLAFHDAEPLKSMPMPPRIKLMTQAQAGEIWDFVRGQPVNIGAVVVHCEGGVSRSPAVAAALCRGLGGDDSRFFRQYKPNAYVYKLMCEMGRKYS
jgi:predicted protein tyrosine phosphatase